MRKKPISHDYFNTRVHCIDTTTGYSGAALHLQVKFSVVTNPSATTNATEVISVYLGKNYEATKSRYETRKDIKMEHMRDKVDHRFYTLFVDFRINEYFLGSCLGNDR
jgi:hypothetical protein